MITRRDLLKAALGSGAMLLLAACGQPTAPAKPARPTESGPTRQTSAAPSATTAPAVTTAPQPAKPIEANRTAEPAKPVAGGSTSAPQSGGQLRVGLANDMLTFDPHISTAASDRQAYQSIYDTLVRLDKDLSIKPGLAKSWEQPDPTTIVFKLQPGVKYHDGEPFNAASVKANFERMMSHPKSLRKGDLSDFKSVDVVDDLTVKVNLKQPSSPLLASLTDRAGMMVSIKAAEAAGDEFGRKPVGTGPFTFVEWVKDDRVVVRKFAGYWEKDAASAQLPYLDEVVYKPIPDGNQRLNALKTNTIDIIDTPNAKDMPALKAGTDPVYSEVPGVAYRSIGLNMRQAPLDNKAIRQAIAWSIDREAINKVVFFGIGSPGYCGLAPSSFAFDPDFKPYSPRDIAKAKGLVAQAGIANPTFTMLAANAPEEKQLAEVFKEQIAEAGIGLEIQLLEATVIFERALTGDFQSRITGWSGRPDPDGNIFNQIHSKGGQNRSGFSNSRSDQFLEQARATYDLAERKRLYSEVNRIYLEESPEVYLQHRPEVKAFSPRVLGFIHVPDGMIRTLTISLQR